MPVSRHDMTGAKIYIYGIDIKTGESTDPSPCMLCRRFIKNAGIARCVGYINGEITEVGLDNS